MNLKIHPFSSHWVRKIKALSSALKKVKKLNPGFFTIFSSNRPSIRPSFPNQKFRLAYEIPVKARVWTPPNKFPNFWVFLGGACSKSPPETLKGKI